MNKSTTIRVSEETKIALKKLGTMDDSYNTVISRLIDEHNKNSKNQANIQWKIVFDKMNLIRSLKNIQQPNSFRPMNIVYYLNNINIFWR